LFSGGQQDVADRDRLASVDAKKEQAKTSKEHKISN